MSLKVYGLSFLAFLGAAAFVGPALAQTAPSTHHKVVRGKMVKHALGVVSCEEFLTLEDMYRPHLIAWAAGYHQAHMKPPVEVIDIAGIEKVTPMVVEQCRMTPSASLWDIIAIEVKKARQD